MCICPIVYIRASVSVYVYLYVYMDDVCVYMPIVARRCNDAHVCDMQMYLCYICTSVNLQRPHTTHTHTNTHTHTLSLSLSLLAAGGDIHIYIRIYVHTYTYRPWLRRRAFCIASWPVEIIRRNRCWCDIFFILFFFGGDYSAQSLLVWYFGRRVWTSECDNEFRLASVDYSAQA